MPAVENTDQFRFTVNDSFVSKSKQLFDPLGASAVNIDSQHPDVADINERSALLHDILQIRLAQHLSKRLGGKSHLKGHWVWCFVQQNIGRVAAAMVVMDHIVDDVEVAKWNSDASLLNNGSFVVTGTEEMKQLEGCYLFFNKVSNDHVRSGTAVGVTRNIGIRYSEHLARAVLQGVDDIDSILYHLFPSKESANLGNGMRHGYFEDLELQCGLCFLRSDKDELVNTSAESGVFIWDDVILEHLGKKEMSESDFKDKQLQMIGYLIELCYDLALSPSRNVSVNPGFESIIGYFGPQN